MAKCNQLTPLAFKGINVTLLILLAQSRYCIWFRSTAAGNRTS